MLKRIKKLEDEKALATAPGAVADLEARIKKLHGTIERIESLSQQEKKPRTTPLPNSYSAAMHKKAHRARKVSGIEEIRAQFVPGGSVSGK